MNIENTEKSNEISNDSSESLTIADSAKANNATTGLKPKTRGRPKKSAQTKKSLLSEELFPSTPEPALLISIGPTTNGGTDESKSDTVLSGKQAKQDEQPTVADESAVVLEPLRTSTGKVNRPDVISSPWYVLTNRSNLLSIIGAGAVTTAPDAWRYVEDSRHAFNGIVPVWRETLPPEVIAFMEGKGVASPVLLEFFPELETLLPVGEKDLRLCTTPIPFSKVQRVVFKDKETLEDFELKQFDDLPELPRQLLHYRFPELKAGTVSKSEVPTASKFSFGVFDRQIGALVFATDALEGRTGAQELYCSLLAMLLRKLVQPAAVADSGPPLATKRGMGFAMSDSVSDLWLLDNTIVFLDGVDLDAGFNERVFLDFIQSAAKDSVEAHQGISSEDGREILEWCGHCRQLLDGTREIWALTDTQHTFVKRGVLLFILRPEQERFRKVMASAIKPGPRVYLLAAFLLGYMTGVTRLETATKKNGKHYFSLVEHFLNVACRGVNVDGSDVNVKTLRPSNDQMRVEVRHGEVLISSWDVSISPAIRKAYHMTREAGVVTTIEFYKNMLTIMDVQKKQNIQIQEIAQEPDGDRIRIYSDLKPMNSRKENDVASTLRAMLDFNGLESTHGKFATVGSGANLVYAVDCAISSLTPVKIRFLVRHVAEVAANFGQRILGAK
jgi:hypothetical protein